MFNNILLVIVLFYMISWYWVEDVWR
jgi:hypothetical protein